MTRFKIIIAVLALGLILWIFGFSVFALRATSFKPYNPAEPSSAIVVLTGGDGRIDAGLDLFAARRGLYLYITSVHPNITEENIRDRWHGETPLPICCITLDYEADSTVENAEQTKAWITLVQNTTGQKISSIRLVTSDYHIQRALVDFKRVLPNITVYPHPIISRRVHKDNELYWRVMMTEYHKYLVRVLESFGVRIGKKVF